MMGDTARRSASKPMRDIAVDRVMTTDPSTVESGDPLSVAQQQFESGAIHHLPVVSDGTLVGIISSSDLLKFHLLDGGTAAVPSATVDQVMESNPVVLERERERERARWRGKGEMRGKGDRM